MNRLRLEIESLGLSFKREAAVFLASLGGFLCCFALLFLWLGFSFIALLPVFLAIIFAYLYLARYGAMKRKKTQEKEDEFVILFTYFSIYMENGFNVYHGLESVMPYSKTLEEPLRRLLLEIDEDKSAAPFLRFAENFDDLAFREVMLSIYEMVEEEAGPYLSQFNRRFNRLADEKHKAERERATKRLTGMTALPLIGSGITMMILVVSVLEVLGGMIDGL